MEAEGEGWKIPQFPGKQFFEATADIAWFETHQTEAPLATYTTPLEVDAAALDAVTNGFVALEQRCMWRCAPRNRWWRRACRDCGAMVLERRAHERGGGVSA